MAQNYKFPRRIKTKAIKKYQELMNLMNSIHLDGQDEKRDYEHFTIPFLLTVDEALAKIQNLNQRILPGGTLFPDIVKQYDEYSIRLVEV